MLRDKSSDAVRQNFVFFFQNVFLQTFLLQSDSLLPFFEPLKRFLKSHMGVNYRDSRFDFFVALSFAVSVGRALIFARAAFLEILVFWKSKGDD